MYLLNQIVQAAPTSAPIPLASRNSLERISNQLMLTDARYVLMPDLAELCREIVLEQADLLGDCFDLIRLPARVVWIEWCEPSNRESGRHHERIGLMVRSDEGGRSGTIQVVWEVYDEKPRPAPAQITFRFDENIDVSGKRTFRHSAFDLSKVLGHFWFEQSELPRDQQLVSRIAEAIWLAGPMVAAFCMLLLFRDEIEHRERDHNRLNVKRARLGKPPLLRHMEVHSRLFSRAEDSGHRASRSGTPKNLRLHHVRGHFVRRGNKVFWRRPHLRGDTRFGTAEMRTTVVGL